ncbi:MAG: hypothetical protein AAF483_25300 [Planctomycetota bacterium]
MNQEFVLQIVQQELEADLAVMGRASPIGVIVPRVARLLREENQTLEFKGVVPMAIVAAFIDGTLDAEGNALVCRAIESDNSVLAEIIAGVRANLEAGDAREPVAPISAEGGLPTSLADRLNGMVREQFPSTNGPLVQAAVLPSSEAPAENLVQLPSSPKEESRGLASSNRKVWFTVVGLGAMAAMLLIALIGIQLLGGSDPGENLVDNESSNSNAVDSDRQLATQEDERNGPGKVVPDQQPGVELLANDPEQEDHDDSSPEMPRPDIDKSLDDIKQPGSNSNLAEADTGSPTNLIPTTDQNRPAEENSLLAQFEWDKIYGLLTQRVVTQRTAAVQNPAVSSSSDESILWQRVQESQPIFSAPQFASMKTNESLALRTLPYSKAEANLSKAHKTARGIAADIAPNEKTRLVLAPDSGIRIHKVARSNSATQVSLEFGSLALMNVPDGSRLHLRGTGTTGAILQMEDLTSVLVDYAPEGLRVQVRSGRVRLRGQDFEAESFALSSNGRLVKVEHARTLPRWVNGTRDLLPSKVMDMIGEKEDVLRAISEKLRDGKITARDQANYLKLAQLQVSLLGNQFPRLAGSKNPVQRYAAWQRLRTVPSWDPRYRRMWDTFENTLPTRQITATFQQAAQRLRNQKELPVNLVDNLLKGMESQNPTLSNLAYLFLLDKYKQGPNYDPYWTAPNKLRAANLWRSKLGRPAAQQQRPMGAAAAARQNAANGQTP